MYSLPRQLCAQLKLETSLDKGKCAGLISPLYLLLSSIPLRLCSFAHLYSLVFGLLSICSSCVCWHQGWVFGVLMPRKQRKQLLLIAGGGPCILLKG